MAAEHPRLKLEVSHPTSNHGVTRRLLAAKDLLREFRQCLRRAKAEASQKKKSDKKLVPLVPQRQTRGRVLFSYIIDGFLLTPGKPVPNRHTNIWQSLKMAETFLERGYAVDVISYRNQDFVPSVDYEVIVDVRRNLERLAPLLSSECLKIMHLDTANILFHNAAGARRVLQLQQRRGITLRQRRYEAPNRGLECADHATIIGGDFAASTFEYAKKKLYRLPTPCGVMYDWPDRKWADCRKSFLWFSSGGLVHKGLDLALEAFVDMPDYRLTVCAPLEQEPDFVDAFKKELYETENIRTVGWVDVESSRFRKIIASCGAMLHLSCSECGGTAVKMCMHAGLVPIVSYESGVDVDGFGFMLEECSLAKIKETIGHVATLPQHELEERARKAWGLARQNYTRENFAAAYRRFVSEITA